MVLYFAGPLLIFMSLLALRDVLLAFFSLLFVFPATTKSRYLGLLVVALLRPHLAAALVFGLIAEYLYRKAKPSLLVTSHVITLLISYAIGALSFPIGNYVMNGNQLKIPSTIFSIEYFSQVGLNLVGLQFLILDGEDAGVVAASTIFLLFARLIFIDTILVPSTFLFFFYGLIFQNQIVTNSTRQNMPFITVMGVIAVIRICDYRAIKSQHYSLGKIEVPTA
jgi:cytochrome c oxidase subunit IV